MDIMSNDDQTKYLFHHLFLPTKLPGGDEMSVSNTIFLTNFVLQSLQCFTTKLGQEDAAIIYQTISMLQTMRDTTDINGFLAQIEVQRVLKVLASHSMSLHNVCSIFSTNTCFCRLYRCLPHFCTERRLIIRNLENSYCFETFELSPTNAAVMTATGRLVRQFPDTATEISEQDFQNEVFQEVLVNTLVKMSHQRVPEVQPKARKARKDHHEDRETTDPRIVTELLTSFLRGAGKPVEVEAICKNTREETSYSNSRLPWRRSPVWLLIRVGLQLSMCRLSDGSDNIYKRFMIYLMAQVLLKANRASTPSELLHIMMTKISRRLCKLEGLCNDEWLSTVRDIVSAASKNLRERWERIRICSEKPLNFTFLSSIEMEDHLLFSVPQIDSFIASILHRGGIHDTSSFSPVAHVSLFNADSLPFVRTQVGNVYAFFNLATIESWVQHNLDQWIKEHIDDESVCTSLKTLLESYHSTANAWYSSRPEGASRMLLTIGEIWVAADKAALHKYPMLKDYNAEVPTNIWQALLFQSKADMARLLRLENYLMGRKWTPSRPSVFRAFGDSMSFPVRYFQQSPMLQNKKIMIEEKAELDKQAKINEFYQLKDKYNNLMRQCNTMTCGQIFETSLGVRYLKHDPFCCRCSLVN